MNNKEMKTCDYMKKAKQENCKHKFRVSAVMGIKTKSLRCTRCDIRIDVPLTKEEVKGMKEQHKKDEKHTKKIHSLGWAYQKVFRLDGTMGFKYKGYEMMKRMEKFAQKHPEVVICGCDDSYHAGSMVAFIPHRADTEYWGTTVVIIPQCSGDPALEMFFYPGHAEEIEKALHVFNQEARKKAKLGHRKNRYWPKP